MSDKYWILGLLIILGVTLFAMFTLPLLVAVYGQEPDNNCVQVNMTNLIIVTDKQANPLFMKGDCYTTINYILGKYSGYKVNYENINGYERWTFIK